MPWYCLKTQPKREQIAARSIQAQDLARVYAPELIISRKTRAGKKRFRESLFPGYIFVNTELKESYRAIKFATGASNFVCKGLNPVEVSDHLIQKLRDSYAGDEPAIVPDASLTPGTEIEIIEGAFKGENGLVIASLSSKNRIKVLLEFLGRDIEIDIPIHTAFASSN